MPKPRAPKRSAFKRAARFESWPFENSVAIEPWAASSSAAVQRSARPSPSRFWPKLAIVAPLPRISLAVCTSSRAFK